MRTTMQAIKKALLLLLPLFLLSSCVVFGPGAVSEPAFSQSVPEGLDYGECPKEDYVEKIVRAYLHDTLKDPFSVRELRLSKPEKGRYVKFGKAYVGWESAYVFYAKNGYGAYGKGVGSVVMRGKEIIYIHTYD